MINVGNIFIFKTGFILKPFYSIFKDFKFGQENYKIKKYLFVILIFILFQIHILASIINLNEIPVYTNDGFDISWTDPDFIPGKDWIKINGNRSGKRTLIVKQIQYNSKTDKNRSYFSTEKSNDYTFIFRFDIENSVLLSGRFLGGIFSAIGPNYQIYINGHLVDSQMFLDSDHKITKRKHTKKKYFELQNDFLRSKNNNLLLRITGEPYNEKTGVIWDSPNEIDYYESIVSHSKETLILILICLYLIICIYNLYLFVNYPQHKYYLYYAMFSFILLSYIFVRTVYFNHFAGNSSITNKMELIILYFVFPSFGFFICDLLFRRIKKFVWYNLVFSAILAVFCIAGNTHTIDLTLKLWQLTAVVPISYYILYSITSSFMSHYENYKNELSVRKNIYSIKKIFWKTISRSVPGNLLAGALILMIVTVYDIINSAFFNNYIFLSQYANLVFLITVTIIISRRFYYLAEKYEFVNRELIQNVKHLNSANKQTMLSNKRYKLLADESNEIIFIMDKDFIFKEVNTMVYNHLKYDPSDLIGRSFYDILYADDKHGEIAKEVVNENIEKLFDTDDKDNSVNFKVLLRSRFESEPVEMRVYMVLLISSDTVEIIGKAYPVTDDALVKYLDEELQLYSIDNYIMLAEDMTFRLTRNLSRYTSANNVNVIRVALREMIMNAIEHGNLGITFDEKSESLKKGNYIEFLTNRQKEISHLNKKVIISYYLSKDKVKYIVEDEGSGFDYKKFLLYRKNKNEDGIMLHGRGISITKNIFDEIEYNDKGNKVALIKYFEKIKN